MLMLFTATIFLSALLLFLVQPLMGRLILPLLGGAPAVWNTAMVFFQAALLAGYGYAHWSIRWLGLRRQVLVHFGLLVLPVLVLPIALPSGWTPPASGNPVWWVLAALGAVVGLPFFVVAASGPLLQRWFSATGHRQAADPYFLYAASNAGSLLALVAYPLGIEPRLRLAEQSIGWALGYGLLVVLLVVCGLRVRRGAVAAEPVGTGGTEAVAVEAPVALRRRMRWVLLGFVPCSLMLSVTTYMTSEIAPVPLLWVIPLGIYLLSFILVFARRQLVPPAWWRWAVPVTVLAVVITMVGQLVQPMGWLIALHLLNLLVVAMVCHGELAADRPPAAQLTAFYLWMSVGGVLGGMFNALLAPVLFQTVAEYPFTLVLMFLLLWRRELARPRGGELLLDFGVPLLIGGVAVVLSLWRVDRFWMLGVPAVLCLLLWRRPLGFGLAVAAVVVANLWVPRSDDLTVVARRSFFGIHRVGLDPYGRFHMLAHGNTIHGLQHLAPERRREPTGYYTREAAFGQAYERLPEPLRQKIGVIGLGSGALSAYATTNQHWTFFEIDPVVEQLARNPELFSFLAESPAPIEVILGDARLSLARVPDGRFGTLVLDAYSSDSVPLHLITREALALYRRKLAADGVLLFHISNRHLRLERVVAALAQDAGMGCLVQADPSGPDQMLETGKIRSKWAVLSPNRAWLEQLGRDRRWQSPPPRYKVRVWTDDYASLFSVLAWR